MAGDLGNAILFDAFGLSGSSLDMVFAYLHIDYNILLNILCCAKTTNSKTRKKDSAI